MPKLLTLLLCVPHQLCYWCQRELYSLILSQANHVDIYAKTIGSRGYWRKGHGSQQKHRQSAWPPAKQGSRPVPANLAPGPCNLLLPRQIFSTKVSAPNEELPSEQHKGCLFLGPLSRGLTHKEAFSHLKVLLAGLTGALCTTGPCLQMVEAICFVNWQMSFIIGDRDWILGPLAGESCWIFFFQDGLAATWQTEMFSRTLDLKIQSSSIEKCQPDFMRWLNPAVQFMSTYSCRLFFGYFTSISSLSPSVLWIASSQEMEIKSLPLVHPQRLGQGWDRPAPIQTCPLTDYWLSTTTYAFTVSSVLLTLFQSCKLSSPLLTWTTGHNPRPAARWLFLSQFWSFSYFVFPRI